MKGLAVTSFPCRSFATALAFLLFTTSPFTAVAWARAGDPRIMPFGIKYGFWCV
jgi:hypothetical protein